MKHLLLLLTVITLSSCAKEPVMETVYIRDTVYIKEIQQPLYEAPDTDVEEPAEPRVSLQEYMESGSESRVYIDDPMNDINYQDQFTHTSSQSFREYIENAPISSVVIDDPMSRFNYQSRYTAEPKKKTSRR